MTADSRGPNPPSLASLTGSRAAVPRPPFRWRTRIALPALILLCGAGLIGYAAREHFTPVIDVEVAPVVLRAAPASETGPAGADPNGQPRTEAASGPTVVAPGWVEPDPFAIGVPALVEGIVREVLVLEGQAVAAGAVVARLVDDDLRLAHAEAEAELVEREAETARARAALGPAQADVVVAEAEEAVLRDEVTRKRPLVQAGGVSEGDFRRLELRLQSAEAATLRARSELTLMEADIPRMTAAEGVARVAVARAALDLARAEVRTEHAGVVLSINARPGARSVMNGAGAESLAEGLIMLYNPASLQVRTDVPLADAGSVGVGAKAEITTEAIPGRVFAGVISRVVHRADIQRNTVQFKVRIQTPDAALKPEMLCRVKFNPGGAAPTGSPGDTGPETNAYGGTLFVDARAIIDRAGGEGAAWVMLPAGSSGARVERRPVKVADAEPGFLRVFEGLRPGDRVVLSPPASLHHGARVRATEVNTTNGGNP